jgi:D-alanine-D-alanine ligase
MLVEEYIHGREFTVGILGNGSDLRVFPPMEIIYIESKQIQHL